MKKLDTNQNRRWGTQLLCLCGVMGLVLWGGAGCGLGKKIDEADDAAVAKVEHAVHSLGGKADHAGKVVVAQAGNAVHKATDVPADKKNDSDSSETPEEADSHEAKQNADAHDVAGAKPAGKAKAEADSSDWDDIKEIMGTILHKDDDSDDGVGLGTILNDKGEGGNNDDTDGLAAMIPGANSPVIKRWREGKYKGHEAQAFEDALDDPQAWRLVFFLSGM